MLLIFPLCIFVVLFIYVSSRTFPRGLQIFVSPGVLDLSVLRYHWKTYYSPTSNLHSGFVFMTSEVYKKKDTHFLIFLMGQPDYNVVYFDIPSISTSLSMCIFLILGV